jgi:hypothetical protein
MTLSRVHVWTTPQLTPTVILPNDLVGSTLEAEFANIRNKFGSITYTELNNASLLGVDELVYYTEDTSITVATHITAAVAAGQRLVLGAGIFNAGISAAKIELPRNFILSGVGASRTFIKEDSGSTTTTMFEVIDSDDPIHFTFNDLTMQVTAADLTHDITIVNIIGGSDTSIEFNNVNFSCDGFTGEQAIKCVYLGDDIADSRCIKFNNCLFDGDGYNWTGDGAITSGTKVQDQLVITRCIFKGFKCAVKHGLPGSSISAYTSISDSQFHQTSMGSGVLTDASIMIGGPSLIHNCYFLLAAVDVISDNFISINNSSAGFAIIRACTFESYYDDLPYRAIDAIGDRLCIENNNEISTEGGTGVDTYFIRFTPAVSASLTTYKDNYSIDPAKLYGYVSATPSMYQSVFGKALGYNKLAGELVFYPSSPRIGSATNLLASMVIRYTSPVNRLEFRPEISGTQLGIYPYISLVGATNIAD